MLQSIVQSLRFVEALAPITPSGSTPDFINMGHYQRCLIVIQVDNASNVTGSAITLVQATTVSGGSAKTLAFTKMYANTDTAAGDTPTETAVTNNTFTTDTTNNKNLMYLIEVDSANLDQDNNFKYLRLGTGNAANTIVSACYVLEGRFTTIENMPSAIV